MIKVRFHLGRGDNYLKWQVKVKTKEGEHAGYYEPDECCLSMYKCRLTNQKTAAQRINKGENKTVCAWVKCNGISVFIPSKIIEEKEKKPIYYNPKVAPYWRDEDGNNIDNEKYDNIISIGRQLYVINKTK
jgi:hypothetical protein